MKLFPARLWFIIILFFTSPVMALAGECETHNTCDTGQYCACRIAAEWVYNRYYYFDLQHLTKGHVFQCKFSSSPSSFIFLSGDSQFPPGSTVQCNGADCPHFPLTLAIDTTNLVAEEDTAIIKFLVPFSDMPDNVSVNCTADAL